MQSVAARIPRPGADSTGSRNNVFVIFSSRGWVHMCGGVPFFGEKHRSYDGSIYNQEPLSVCMKGNSLFRNCPSFFFKSSLKEKAEHLPQQSTSFENKPRFLLLLLYWGNFSYFLPEFLSRKIIFSKVIRACPSPAFPRGVF